MKRKAVINWLMEGDVSIQYQTKRDLLGVDDQNLRKKIGTTGWGQAFLSFRQPDGHWGQRFYQPKWISTHYTLLDLRHLNLPADNVLAKTSIDIVLENLKAEDGGIQLGPSTSLHSDVCVNAMFLNYASYFGAAEPQLTSVVDAILKEKMPDGGFNCRTTRSGAVHSSLHTTISVLEGLQEFVRNGYEYRMEDIKKAQETSIEFILLHQLFLSDRTGKIIHKDFLKLHFPTRWKYDILRALDFFQYAKVPWDERMQPAIEVLLRKRNKQGTWNVNAHYPGEVHLEMEKAGKPSRWNTLRALRVLKFYKVHLD